MKSLGVRGTTQSKGSYMPASNDISPVYKDGMKANSGCVNWMCLKSVCFVS